MPRPLLVPGLALLLFVPSYAFAEPIRGQVDVSNDSEVDPVNHPAPQDDPPPPQSPEIDPPLSPSTDSDSPCDDPSPTVWPSSSDDSTAYVGGPVPNGPPVHLLDGSHWEGEIGVEGSPAHGMSAADLSGPSIGLAASLGHQFGPFRLSGEYSIAKVSAERDLYTTELGTSFWDGTQSVSGEASRYGASVRARGILATPSDGRGMGANLSAYAEAGVGRESISWDGGATLHRDDVSVGGGFEMAFGRERMGGFDLGARLLFAPSATPNAVPACSGQCMPSSDGGHDVAVLLHLGVLFGG